MVIVVSNSFYSYSKLIFFSCRSCCGCASSFATPRGYYFPGLEKEVGGFW